MNMNPLLDSSARPQIQSNLKIEDNPYEVDYRYNHSFDQGQGGVNPMFKTLDVSERKDNSNIYI